MPVFQCVRRCETFPRPRTALATYRPARWESCSSHCATPLVNLSSQRISKGFIAVFPLWAARRQSAVMLRNASQIILVAASLLGKCPRVLMTLRSRAFTPLPMFWLSRDDEIDLVDDHHSPYECWQHALPRIDMVLSTPDLSNAVPVIHDRPDFLRRTPALPLGPFCRGARKARGAPTIGAPMLLRSAVRPGVWDRLAAS